MIQDRVGRQKADVKKAGPLAGSRLFSIAFSTVMPTVD
jgi:hypothetical protein